MMAIESSGPNTFKAAIWMYKEAFFFRPGMIKHFFLMGAAPNFTLT